MFGRLLAIFLLLSLHSADARQFLHGSGAGAGSASFTPAWQSIKAPGGGLLEGVHAYSPTVITTHGDSFGGWQYVATGSTTRDGQTYAAPAWALCVTTDSLPSGDVTFTNAVNGNVGSAELVLAPNTLTSGLVWYNNKIYFTNNSCASLVWTGLTVNYNPNGHENNTDWIHFDPNNANIAYMVTPHGTFGPSDGSSGNLLVNTAVTTCTSNCWTAVSGIPTPAGSATTCTGGGPGFCGGNIVYDPNSAVTGGVTQHFIVSIKGSTGVWETTNGGTSFTQRNAGSPPTNVYQMMIDTFGQFWAVEAGLGPQGNVFKYSSSTWTEINVGAVFLYGIRQDPHTGGTQSANQMIAIDNSGQIIISLNNGTDGFSHVIGFANLTLTSTAPQAPWLNVINQYSGGQLQLNIIAVDIDSNGKIWAGTGIDMFTTADPITSGVVNGSAVWTANDIGLDQLVANTIVSPPGMGLSATVWDRGWFANLNPDVPAASQYANNSNNCSGCPPIVGGWNVDYVPGTPATMAAVLGGQGGGSAIAISTNGGGTISQCANVPSVGVAPGGVIAMSTTTNWAMIPGTFSGQNSIISYTTSACASAWATATFTGSPSPGLFIGTNIGYFANRQPLVSDRVTANTYYLVDLNGVFFDCTGTTLVCVPTGLTVSGNLDGSINRDRIIQFPKLGSTSTAGWAMYLAPVGHLWITKNGFTSASQVCGSTMDAVYNAGIGAPKPGSNVATIYIYQGSGGTKAQGFYENTDGATTTTCSAVSIPSSENLYPYRVLDTPAWMTGDSDIYGRIAVGYLGSGPGPYIDAQDACPAIQFSNVLPNATVGASVSLQAQSSGNLATLITAVNFYDNGSLIGSQTLGTGSPKTYSQSWSPTTGAHTIKVEAIGNSCGVGSSNSKSIPVTH